MDQNIIDTFPFFEFMLLTYDNFIYQTGQSELIKLRYDCDQQTSVLFCNLLILTRINRQLIHFVLKLIQKRYCLLQKINCFEGVVFDLTKVNVLVFFLFIYIIINECVCVLFCYIYKIDVIFVHLLEEKRRMQTGKAINFERELKKI